MVHGILVRSENGEVILDPAPGHGGKINYEAFIDALYQHGYDGYLTSEYCLPVLRNHQLCGIEDVDEATRQGIALYETTGTAYYC